MGNKGYIATNYHVIKPAFQNGYKLVIETHDGKKIFDYRIGTCSDERSIDLCFLKVGVKPEESFALKPVVPEKGENIFVIGSRYMEGGKCDMKGFRLFLSYHGNKFIKFLSGINCDEFTTSFRGFSLKKLNDFHLNNVNSKGYSFFMETVHLLHKKGIIIKQVPIYFKDREKGKSKILNEYMCTLRERNECK